MDCSPAFFVFGPDETAETVGWSVPVLLRAIVVAMTGLQHEGGLILLSPADWRGNLLVGIPLGYEMTRWMVG